jgi:hypothetical protein
MGTTGAFRLVVQLWRGEQRGSAMICVEMLQVRGAMRPALAVGVRTGDRNSWMPQLSIALSKMAENVLCDLAAKIGSPHQLGRLLAAAGSPLRSRMLSDIEMKQALDPISTANKDIEDTEAYRSRIVSASRLGRHHRYRWSEGA